MKRVISINRVKQAEWQTLPFGHSQPSSGLFQAVKAAEGAASAVWP